MTLKEKISFIKHLPLRRKAWLLVCFVGSLVTLPIIHVLPSKYLHHFLGHSLENRQLCVLTTQTQLLHARQIASLMQTVANNVPWPCQCLAQALIVNWLFRRHKIPAVTYLGAKLSPEEPEGMKAHAWVCVGPKTVIGNHDNEYPVVGTFTSSPF